MGNNHAKWFKDEERKVLVLSFNEELLLGSQKF